MSALFTPTISGQTPQSGLPTPTISGQTPQSRLPTPAISSQIPRPASLDISLLPPQGLTSSPRTSHSSLCHIPLRLNRGSSMRPILTYFLRDYRQRATHQSQLLRRHCLSVSPYTRSLREIMRWLTL